MPCRVCGSDQWQTILDLGVTPLANRYLAPHDPLPEPRYPLVLQRCPVCWLMGLSVVVPPNVLYSQYYYRTSESQTMRAYLDELAVTCQAWLSPGDLVVEIGSNTGTLLRRFVDRGHPVLGVDPSENLAVQATRSHVPTVPVCYGMESLDQLMPYGQPRLIIGRHVLAHIDNVHGVCDALRRHLAPHGVCLFEVQYGRDLIMASQFDTIYHEHLSTFLVTPLGMLFHQHGLKLVDVSTAAVNGGSLVVMVQREEEAKRPTENVQQWFDRERTEQWGDGSRYQMFAQRVQAIQTGFGELVRSQRGSVAGDGAPAKATTLFQACGLTARHVQWMADTTPEKQGLVMPGTHIPIRAHGEHPSAYILTAWNYRDEILKKEDAYLRHGGKFLTPLPMPTVLELVPA